MVWMADSRRLLSDPALELIVVMSLKAPLEEHWHDDQPNQPSQQFHDVDFLPPHKDPQ